MAHYAESSQRLYWRYTEDQFANFRSLDYAHMTRNEYKTVQMYLYELVKTLAEKLSLRQQAIATAMVYLLRFYTRAAFVETNVYMVVAAAVYLACKIEECPVHIKVLTTEIQTVWGLGKVSSDTQKLAETEFYLIEELNTYLIIYHPYRTLAAIGEEHKNWQKDIDEAWTMVNESYNTDIPLCFDPDIIAHTCVYMTLIRQQYSRDRPRIPSNFIPKHLPLQQITACAYAFLSFWRFRDTIAAKARGELILRRAKAALNQTHSGGDDQDLKNKRYRDKIQAMQKR